MPLFTNEKLNLKYFDTMKFFTFCVNCSFIYMYLDTVEKRGGEKKKTTEKRGRHVMTNDYILFLELMNVIKNLYCM